jgi:hypothetical protein
MRKYKQDPCPENWCHNKLVTWGKYLRNRMVESGTVPRLTRPSMYRLYKSGYQDGIPDGLIDIDYGEQLAQSVRQYAAHLYDERPDQCYRYWLAVDYYVNGFTKHHLAVDRECHRRTIDRRLQELWRDIGPWLSEEKQL